MFFFQVPSDSDPPSDSDWVNVQDEPDVWDLVEEVRQSKTAVDQGRFPTLTAEEKQIMREFSDALSLVEDCGRPASNRRSKWRLPRCWRNATPSALLLHTHTHTYTLVTCSFLQLLHARVTSLPRRD